MENLPPHAFSPFLNVWIEDGHDAIGGDLWRGTGVSGAEYFAIRNDNIPLIVAAQSNDIHTVRNLLGFSVSDIDARGLEGETALHMASALGYVDLIHLLISKGASVDAQDEEGSTPLVHCVRFCHPGTIVAQIVSILLDAGANPTHSVGVDLSMLPPLVFAIQAGCIEAVRLLAPLTPLTPPTGRNYIMEAAIAQADQCHNTTILTYLLSQGLHVSPHDVSRATEDQTFDELARHLGLADMNETAIIVLESAWARDRRHVVQTLTRLVKRYRVNINEDDVQKFVVTRQNTDLLRSAAELGLDLKSVAIETLRNWAGTRKPEYVSVLMELHLGAHSSDPV